MAANDVKREEEEGGSRSGREDHETTGGAVVVKARVAPSGAFGLPMSYDLVCRSIVFLDDALCAFPVGHGVLLVESERGRQVAFVPGTPGQRKVTAIAAKKCFGGGSARERSEDFLEQEEEERGKGGQQRREAGVSSASASSASASGPITFTGENASLLAIAESGDEEIGPSIVLCAIHRQTQRRARLRTFLLRDAIGTDGKKSSSSSSSATVASMSGCFDEYAFTEVCFSTDGASIVAKVQRISDENDWTLRSWTFSDLTKRTNVSNDGNINSNQELSTSNPFPASSAYSDIFFAGKKSSSVSNVSHVIGFLPEPARKRRSTQPFNVTLQSGEF